MDAVAVILPALENRFDASRREALLTAHATQLLRACSRGGRGCTVAVDGCDAHDVLGRLEAFRPSHVVIEHSPLAYGNGEPNAIAAAAWARAHRLPVLLVSHPEYGRHSDAFDALVTEGLIAAGPLVAQATRLFCHERSWARALAQRLPSCAERLELVGEWSVLAPSAVRPVDADAPQLLLIDALPRPPLVKMLAEIATRGGRYRVAMLYAGEAGRERLENAIGEAGLRQRVVPLAELSDEHLAAALAECSRVVIAASRYAGESARWARTALAFGRGATILERDGTNAQVDRTCASWATIAHIILAGGSDRALAAPLEEDVEEPTIGI